MNLVSLLGLLFITCAASHCLKRIEGLENEENGTFSHQTRVDLCKTIQLLHQVVKTHICTCILRANWVNGAIKFKKVTSQFEHQINTARKRASPCTLQQSSIFGANYGMENTNLTSYFVPVQLSSKNYPYRF